MPQTTATLITAARRRVDAFGSDTFTDAEIVDYLNWGVRELYELLLATYGDQYYSTSAFYSISAVTNPSEILFSLTTHPFKITGVELVTTDGYKRLEQVRGAETVLVARKDWQSTPPRYTQKYERLTFFPPSLKAESIRLHYVPMPTELSTSSPTAALSPWLEPWWQYIVLVAAAHMMDRIEQDATLLVNQKTSLIALIQAGKNHDSNSYPTITDVEYQDEVWEY